VFTLARKSSLCFLDMNNNPGHKSDGRPGSLCLNINLQLDRGLSAFKHFYIQLSCSRFEFARSSGRNRNSLSVDVTID
jgi:hypothetical protein